MKLKVVVPEELEAEDVTVRAAAVAEGTVGADVVLDWTGVRSPRQPGSDLDETLLAVAVAEAAIDAETAGYDAVVVHSFLDPGLYALRSRLTIPVVGAGLAAYALSVDLGLRFAVLSPDRRQRHAIEKSIRLYGLSGRCAAIRAVTGDRDLLLAEATAAVEENGADVVLLGSTTMCDEAAFLAERLPCPVVDPGPVALKTAERLVRLGLAHSKVAFPTPNVQQDEKLAPLLRSGT